MNHLFTSITSFWRLWCTALFLHKKTWKKMKKKMSRIYPIKWQSGSWLTVTLWLCSSVPKDSTSLALQTLANHTFVHTPKSLHTLWLSFNIYCGYFFVTPYWVGKSSDPPCVLSVHINVEYTINFSPYVKTDELTLVLL